MACYVALCLAEGHISQTFLQLSESMCKFCPMGRKEKCPVVIWGGFLTSGEKSLVHQVTSVLLGTGMLMPGVLAGMLDHEDKGSRDSATKSWEKPGPPVMVQSCRESPGCLFRDYFMFSITLCFFKPLIVVYLVPPGTSSFTCPIQMFSSSCFLNLSKRHNHLPGGPGPKPRNHASS